MTPDGHHDRSETPSRLRPEARPVLESCCQGCRGVHDKRAILNRPVRLRSTSDRTRPGWQYARQPPARCQDPLLRVRGAQDRERAGRPTVRIARHEYRSPDNNRFLLRPTSDHSRNARPCWFEGTGCRHDLFKQPVRQSAVIPGLVKFLRADPVVIQASINCLCDLLRITESCGIVPSRPRVLEGLVIVPSLRLKS